MDPTDVLRTLWQQRRYVLPALVLALAAAAYVYGFAPRSYESTSTWALVNPAVPTAEDLERDPALDALNADNPYLRSADTNLITDALIARLGAASTVKQLQADGVGTDYGVGPGVGGNGFVVDITGVGPTPEDAIATTSAVGAVLEAELDDLQRVNGADDRYLFTPLLLTPPDDATEQFSSRLRAVIVVLLGGAVLVFAAASLGRWRGRARERRAARAAVDAPPGAPEASTPPARDDRGASGGGDPGPGATGAEDPDAADQDAADPPRPEPSAGDAGPGTTAAPTEPAGPPDREPDAPTTTRPTRAPRRSPARTARGPGLPTAKRRG